MPLPVAAAYPEPTDTLCFVIVSTCPDAWGGSEELWRGAALHLKQAGHAVHIFKTHVQATHPRIRELRAAGCTITDLLAWPKPTVLARLRHRVLPARWWPQPLETQALLSSALQGLQPHLTIFSQGGNLDGVGLAQLCAQQGQPYALVVQKATEIFLIYDEGRQAMQQVYRAAAHCFFVSRHNLELTQCQLGQRLPRASVVHNPFNVPYAGELPAPPAEGAWQLACVARLDILDKGQDLLLHVLARPHWRARPLHVTFFGAGPQRQGLAEMADFLEVEAQVSFAGQVADVPGIWRTHHALVLPSRYEGLPLALVEAMLCGRPAIAAPAGGVAELLLDNVTGFLATAPTVDALDEALERAWARRADWPQIGAQAAHHARASVPPDPTADFGRQLLQLAHSLTSLPQAIPN
jgi:glycosyltransferase involved in cell wall biosynthesis